MNRVDFTVRGPAGDSMRIGFHEGLATLVSPRWSVEHHDLFPYKSLLSIKIMGRKASSERGAQGLVLRRDDGFRLEVWNTHLEVLSFQRLSQATELAFVADSLRWTRLAAGPSGRLLMGDLNADPLRDADSLLRLSGWRDAWSDAQSRVSEPGNTCCVTDPRSPRSGFRTSGRRIDRILHQGACAVDTSRVLLDEWFLTPAGDTLWASDHGMLVSRLVYGVRP
jgi:endonuclease/exonuclease/phosphatase family metal-dependent hydrolase